MHDGMERLLENRMISCHKAPTGAKEEFTGFGIDAALLINTDFTKSIAIGLSAHGQFSTKTYNFSTGC